MNYFSGGNIVGRVENSKPNSRGEVHLEDSVFFESEMRKTGKEIVLPRGVDKVHPYVFLLK